MATPAARIARPPLPVLLALLLALIAGLSAPPLAVEPTAPGTTVSAGPTVSAGTIWHSDAPVEPADAVEPPAAPMDTADDALVVGGRERVLRTQQVYAVRAARAPPSATV
jgi:hypothetical protein